MSGLAARRMREDRSCRVGFPVAWRLPIAGFCGALRERDSAFNEGDGAAAACAAPSALALGAGEIAAPAEIVGAGDLGVDEAVDGLVADARFCLVAGEAAGDLLWRPALLEALEDCGAQAFVPFEL